MKLQRPKELTFWISVILVALGVLGHLGTLAVFAPYAFWMVVIGFVLLMLGVLFTGI